MLMFHVNYSVELGYNISFVLIDYFIFSLSLCFQLNIILSMRATITVDMTLLLLLLLL